MACCLTEASKVKFVVSRQEQTLGLCLRGSGIYYILVDVFLCNSTTIQASLGDWILTRIARR
jgi:hypothetical protein